MKKCLFVLLTLFLTNLSFGQAGTTALPSLLIPQSPLLEGTGGIGAAIPMQDPMGFYYNPAQLGYFATENNVAAAVMPNKTQLATPFSLQSMTLQTSSIVAGYNFGKTFWDLPLSIGFGYLSSKMNYSPIPNFDYDSFDCFSIGASYDYYLLFNIGFSIKSFNSVFPYEPVPGTNYESRKASGTAFDFGAMVIAPVSKLFFNNVKYNLDQNSFIKPNVNLTFGYSLTNVGKEIYYIDASQSDPIPRTARLGYSLALGLKLFMNDQSINAVDYSFTAEAENLLVRTNPSFTSVSYQGLLGDINFGKNLIELKGNENVAIHRGHIFNIFETFTITFGRITGQGFQDVKSDCIGFSSEGIEKLLGITVDSNALKYVANHFVIKYYNANEFVDTNLHTNFKELAVYAKGIEL